MKKSMKLKFKTIILSLAIIVASLEVSKKTPELINKFQNEEKLKAYDDILEDLKDLLQEEGITDPDEIFFTYLYMVWRGYLSKDQQFYFTQPEYQISFKELGSSCIEGRGVCRNLASMLSDLYQQFGYDTFTVTCDSTSENLNLDKITTVTNISRNINYNKSNTTLTEEEQKILRNLIGDHMITAVNINNEVIYYDPTNLMKFYQNDTRQITAFKNEFKCNLKLISSTIFADSTYLDILKIYFNETNYENKKFEANQIDEEKIVAFYEEHIDEYEYLVKEMIENSDEDDVGIAVLTFIILIGIGIYSQYKISEKKQKTKTYKKIEK